MKSRLFFLAILMIIICLSIDVFSKNSKDTLNLDLGHHSPGSVISIQGNRSYDLIVLKNLVSDYTYNVEIKREVIMLDPLDWSGKDFEEIEEFASDCLDLTEKMNDLINFLSDSSNSKRNEKDLAQIVNNIKAKISTCDNEELKSEAKKLLNYSFREYPEKINVKTGDKISIIVKRDTLVWTFIYKGDENGKWITSYGFGFTSTSLEGSTYYTKQIPDTALYSIIKTKRSGKLDLNYVPAVFFSYFPSQSFNSPWNHSLSAGLGFDLSAPVVFFGYNGMFWQNIGISFGISFQQQNRLKDQFSENDIISINLEKNQLHDQIYRPNLFIAINFRLGENPFKKEPEETSE